MTDTKQQQRPRLRTNHNVRVVIMNDGKQILCLFEEIKNEEQQVIAFRFVYPYVLTVGEEVNEDGTYPIRFARWCPFSPVQDFRVSGNSITTITLPDDGILENFITELESFGIPRDQLLFEEENGNSSEPIEAPE